MTKNTENNPLITYHATGADFFDFSPSSKGDFGPGVYLAESLEGAKMYLSSRKVNPDIEIVYIGQNAGCQRKFLINQLHNQLKLKSPNWYYNLNRVINYIQRNGKQTKERLLNVIRASECSLANEDALKIANHFTHKNIKIESRTNPEATNGKVLKVELSGLIVPYNSTPKECNLPRMSLETLCKLYNIEYPIKNHQAFIQSVLDKARGDINMDKETSNKYSENHIKLKNLLTEYNKPVPNGLFTKYGSHACISLSGTLTKLAAMSPRIAEGVKTAETLLRIATENMPIEQLQHYHPNFCKLMNISGFKIYDNCFGLTYYLAKNPKACRITEYMSEKTNWQWKPAPKRPLPQEENLYHYFGMKKPNGR